MTYTLIGTGNMAWFLATRLRETGAQCRGVWGRDRGAAQELAAVAGGDVLPAIEDMPEADCCILAVNDSAIAALAKQLTVKHSVIIHTAGSVPLDIIPQEHKAVLWFIYSINKHDLPAHRNIPAVYETVPGRSREIVTGLAGAVSDSVYEATWQQRQWLHLGAVIGNNFTNHLMAVCEQICREQHLPFEILQPILRQTFERAGSPSETQTGPAIRNDDPTIEKHLQLLQQHPLWQQVYRSVTASIKDMYGPER